MSFPAKKLKSGTELPVMNLKGKPYLQVAYRLVWFREDQPEGCIITEITNLSEKGATAKATIIGANGKILATGHKSETVTGFGDFVEKAETGAIGRALAAAGYGTQFAPDLDEGERIVDSPIDVAKKPATVTPIKETKAEDKPVAKDTTPTDRENVASFFKNLERQGKITAEDFKAKYLGGKGLSTLNSTQLKAVLTSLYNDFK